MSFLKSKISNPLSYNLSPEVKFIIWGIFYTAFAMNILLIYRIFDLLAFFCIYFCSQHLLSKPILSKKRFFISFVIIVILTLESLMLIIFVFFTFLSIGQIFNDREGYGLTRLISLFLFLIYWIKIRIKSNPNKISTIIKTIFYEYFQLFFLFYNDKI
jgi:hypothetical protein